MATNDDLDLRQLFGLSPEEAQGLGLDSFGHPPATPDVAGNADDAADAGLPDHAASIAANPHATSATSGVTQRDERLADELALLSLLDGAGGRAHGASSPSSYNGYDAAHGLSLVATVATMTPRSQPAAAVPSRPEQPLDEGDAATGDRFVVAGDGGDGGDGDDDVDVAALFGLSSEEVRGLGLEAVDGAPDEEPAFPSVPFPTMRLRTIDPAGDDDTSITAAADTARPDSGNAGPLAGQSNGDGLLVRSASATDEPLAGGSTGDESEDAGLRQIAPEAALDGLDGRDDRDDRDDRDAVASRTGAPIDPALLDAFAQESAELLDSLHVELEQLERDRGNRAALLEIRRIVHTIKGGAKMCGFDAIASLTHSCENLLDLLADNAASLGDGALRALFECEPLLHTMVQEELAGEAAEGAEGAEGAAGAAAHALAARFDGLCASASTQQDAAAPAHDEGTTAAEPEPASVVADVADVAETPEEATATARATARATSGAVEPQRQDDLTPPASERPAAAEVRPGSRRQANSINVDLSKVDVVVAKVTEMAAHRASSHGMIGRLLETTGDARRNVTRLQSLAMQIGNECASIQPEETAPEDDLALESYNTLNTLVLQLQEAVSDQLALLQAVHDTITNHWSLQATESRVDADIQSALMNIRLLPLASMRVRLDGVVRQAAEATGKKVRWQLQGSTVAVEKNVFDKLFEPLMHLLRNAVDHGIETAAGRRAAGKAETGTITVTAAQDGNQIVITVADDGAGIVPNKIAALAVERGIISADDATALSYQQKMELIFTPGFSTAKEVSHISGRGVGMDAVREACLRMGGTIEISSRQGTGSAFTMRLPLSLSVTRGLIVRDSGRLMAVPVAQVSALHLVPASDIVETPAGRVARLEGQELPVYNLPSLPGAGRPGYIQNGEVNVLQVAHEGGSIGLVIEDVLGEEEILIKAPPALLRGIKTLLGAHVLPDGRVAPVVNLPQMLVDLQPVAMLSAPQQRSAPGEMTALVVDDSMSMRVALSGTLQSAGFKVLTARDGQEALDVLKREGLPGLITLDVEMPRMDGLETLFAIRQMPGAQELPVFMMTSRGGARHRRAAEQLGATRYFTKPYRDSELATAARDACASL